MTEKLGHCVFFVRYIANICQDDISWGLYTPIRIFGTLLTKP